MSTENVNQTQSENKNKTDNCYDDKYNFDPQTKQETEMIQLDYGILKSTKELRKGGGFCN
jgi:hypothetical protein